MSSQGLKIKGLAETLRALRKRKALSQGHLAARMGVHANTVMRMEQTPERITVETLALAAAALGEEAWRILRHVAKKPQPIVGGHGHTGKQMP